MRKVICALNISIDGCYDHTRMNGNEEVLEYFANLMKEVDQIVTGRKMYELMSPYWDDVARTQSGTEQANHFANTVTTIPNIVVSRTMKEVEGGPRVISDNIEEELLKLKSQPGKKISIGGMTLRSQLMKAGLIDEFYVVIHSVIAGSGPRLFDDINLAETIKMDLVDTKVMKSGIVALHYLIRK